MEDDNITLEGVVAKFAENKDTLEAQRDHLAVEKDELQSRIIELESDIEVIAEKFEVRIGFHIHMKFSVDKGLFSLGIY